MAASAVKICSRKKVKASGLSELEKILLGYYIKLEPGSQESRVYLKTKRLRHGKRINKNFEIKLTFVRGLADGLIIKQVVKASTEILSIILSNLV